MIKRDRCGIIFPRDRAPVEPRDDEGCLLPSGHNSPHEFIAQDGKRYWWETDWECDCESCQSDEPDDWCIVYGECQVKHSESNQ